MNTEQDIQASQNASARPEAGTILKNKRESLGLTQKQIADRLKLRITVIQKIEENQFESDLVATFTRGYLRSYAKCVNVDEKVVLDALDHAGDAQHEEQEMQSFSRKTNTEKHNSRIMSLTWGIFVVIVGISSIWWWQNQEQDTLAVTSSEPAVEEQLQEELLSTPSEADLSTIASEELTADFEPTVSNAEQASTATTTTSAAASDEMNVSDTNPAEANTEVPAVIEDVLVVEPIAQVEPLLNELVMQFKADCWIQVKDATGATLSTGIKKAGQSLNLSGTTPYKVVLGAPEGVSMTFASEPVDLSGYTSGKVARITLP